MTVFFDKDRGHWRYDFVRGGKRYSGYCLAKDGQPSKSRRAAEQFEALEKARVVEARSSRRTADAVTLIEVISDVQKTWETESYWPTRRRHILETLAFFGPATPVAAISEADIDDFKTHLLNQKIRVWAGGSKRDAADPDNERFWKESDRQHSASTVNRYLQVIRAVFQRARKMRDPLTHERVITEVPEITDLDEMKRIARPIPDAVLQYVAGVLPQHVKEAMIASLLFGFRRDEMFGLTIADVDFEAGGVVLHAEEVKNRKDALLPGDPIAMRYMQTLVDQAKARGVRHLITWRRHRTDPRKEKWEPIKRPKTAWATAMGKVEEKFGRRYRWHDVRAAFITHVALTAGPMAAQHMARHSTFSTTQGYIGVADEVKRQAAAVASQRPALAFLTEEKEDVA